MKQKKMYRYLYAGVGFGFVVFFITINAIENYIDNQKTLLFVNGHSNLTENQLRNINVDAISYGFWDDKVSDYTTNHKYILIKQKSSKVLMSTNNINAIVKYTNK